MVLEEFPGSNFEKWQLFLVEFTNVSNLQRFCIKNRNFFCFDKRISVIFTANCHRIPIIYKLFAEDNQISAAAQGPAQLQQ